jgi:transposase
LGGEKTGPSPVDRARRGCNHLIACGRGTPLAVSLTDGNRNDITQMVPLVDAIPPVRGRHGRPRRRPRELYGSGLGKKRWVVERTIAWLHQYRRLRIRYERRDDIHEAFPRDRLQPDLPQAPPGRALTHLIEDSRRAGRRD